MVFDRMAEDQSSWPRIRIGDVAQVYDGPHATPTKTATGPIFLGISALNRGRLDLANTEHLSEEDFAKWTKRVVPSASDVVFSYETRIGEAAIIPKGLRCCLGRRMGLVRVDASRLDPHFFLYQYLSPTFQGFLHSRTIHGSTVDRIALKDFPDFEIDLPPLTVQRQIAKVMLDLDSKIDLNRRINQTLEAMAQAIFKSWFVDFDPVKAKIAAIEQGEDPLRAAMRAISGKTDAELDQMPREYHDQLAATAALFPNAMENSELGKIPKGWKVVPASALIEFNPKEPLRKGTAAPYLEMASLPTSGSWAESPIPREFGSGMRFRNGDALLARITPCLENGKSAFIQGLPDETVGWGSTEFIVMRSKKPVPQEYAYLLVRHTAFREHAIRSMTGTSGRQRAQADAIAEFKVVSPSENSVWCAFSELVGSIFKSIKCQSESAETLAELRDTLLSKLLSGELLVADMHQKVSA